MPSIYREGQRVIVVNQGGSANNPPVGAVGIVLRASVVGATVDVDFDPRPPVGSYHSMGGRLPHPTGRSLIDANLCLYHDQSWTPEMMRASGGYTNWSADLAVALSQASVAASASDALNLVHQGVGEPLTLDLGSYVVSTEDHDGMPQGAYGRVIVMRGDGDEPYSSPYGVLMSPGHARGNSLGGIISEQRGWWYPAGKLRPVSVEEALPRFNNQPPVWSYRQESIPVARERRLDAPAQVHTHPVPNGTRVRTNGRAPHGAGHVGTVVHHGLGGGTYHVDLGAQVHPGCHRLDGRLTHPTGYVYINTQLDYEVAPGVFATYEALRAHREIQVAPAIDTFMDGLGSTVVRVDPTPPSWMRHSLTRPQPRTEQVGLPRTPNDDPNVMGLREVVIVDVTGPMDDMGIRVGQHAHLVRESGDNATLRFPNGVIRGGRGRDQTIRRIRYRFTDTDSLPSAQVKKGDRVEVTTSTGHSPPVGTEGVVVVAGSRDSAVDFYPYRWRYGTDVGTGNERSGTQMPNYAIRVLSTPETKELKAFYLMGFKDGKSWVLDDQPTYDTGKEAADAASALSKTLGHKVQARRNAPPDENWRDREKIRLGDGTYKPMPKGWDLKPIEDHFLHLAVKNPGMIAYTPNPDYGSQDRQVFSRPGAYVQKFYPDLPPKDVARYSAIAACDGQLEITNSSAEMVRIYRLGEKGLGPDSCMKYDFKAGHSGLKLPVHPIETYGEGDISLAYLQADGKVSARCLIWPEKKLFTRAYGDIAKIIAILETEGYTRGNFIDAKIKRVTLKHNDETYYVVPYIDDCNSVQGNPQALGVFDDGEHIVIKEQGYGHQANSTSGYMTIHPKYKRKILRNPANCARCGTQEEASDMVPVVTGGTPENFVRQNWCSSCVRNRSYQCTGFDVRMDTAFSRRISPRDRAGYVSVLYFESNGGWKCAISEDYFMNPNAKRVTLHDGRFALEQYFKEHGFHCAGTNQNYVRQSSDTGPGGMNFIKAGGLFYHEDYARAHPELFAKSKGITDTVKAEKKLKTKTARIPSPGDVTSGVPNQYFTINSSTNQWSVLGSTGNFGRVRADLAQHAREALDQLRTASRDDHAVSAEPEPAPVPAPAREPDF